MGLEVELFDGKVAPDLICSICEKVFFDPVVNSCPHVFCRSCIKSRFSSYSTRSCPKCGIGLHPSKTHQPSTELKRRLLNMPLFCSHGCGERFLLAELPEHIKFDCRSVPTSCPNMAKGCRDEILRGEVEWHLEECEFRLVECVACSAMVVQRELFNHQKRNRCTEKRLKQHVTQEFRRINLEVIKHRRQVDRDTLRLEVEQRRRVLDHYMKKQSRNQPRAAILPKSAQTSRTEPSGTFFLTETDDQDRPQTTLAITEDRRKLCKCTKCSKKFNPENNHTQSCRWHPGPIVELFGGTCTMCGHMDYQKGCCLGYHTT